VIDENRRANGTAGVGVSTPATARVPAQTAADGSAERAGSAPSIADGTERSLDPRDIVVSRITSGISAAVLAILVTAASGVLLAVRPIPSPWGGVVAVVLFLVVVLRGAAAWFWPPVRHRHASWRLDEGGLRIRRGVVWRSEIYVPRSRIQHTDISRGPLERSFGLATLVVNTAGTEHSRVTLGGLAAEDALHARDFLLEANGDHDR